MNMLLVLLELLSFFLCNTVRYHVFLQRLPYQHDLNLVA
jgi:hypothetical protein